MLHIIGLILKIIGMILAVILGILVLLVCVILFVPVRYQAEGSASGTLDSMKIRGKVSWLWHLVSVKGSFENGELSWRGRFAWIRFPKEDRGESKKPPKKEQMKERKKSEKAVGNVAGEKVAKATQPVQPVKIEKKPESAKSVETEKKPESAKSVETEKKPESAKSVETENAVKAEQPLKVETVPGIWQRLVQKIRDIYQKIKQFFENIKYTITRICDKIKGLGNKKEALVDFLEKEEHRLAYAKGKKELFRLLRYLKPGRMKVHVRYGFEDPYHTGQVLAVLSVLYAFVGDHMEIEPDFEQAVLEGDFFIKGKIRAIYFVIPAWNLFWDKNVKQTYQEVRAWMNK